MADGHDQYLVVPVAIDNQVRKTMQETAADVVAAGESL
jgi:hypothetical protein